MIGPLPQLASSQLKRIASAYRLARRKTLDIGPASDWPRGTSFNPGRGICIIDTRDAVALTGDAATRCTLAGALPVPQHHCEIVLLRAAALLQLQSASNPESIIGVANLLACLKGNGLFVGVMLGPDQEQHWRDLFAGYPGHACVRTLTAGLLNLPVIRWIMRPAPSVCLFEFRVPRKPISRLDWHRLARQRVLGQSPLAPAA